MFHVVRSSRILRNPMTFAGKKKPIEPSLGTSPSIPMTWPSNIPGGECGAPKGDSSHHQRQQAAAGARGW